MHEYFVLTKYYVINAIYRCHAMWNANKSHIKTITITLAIECMSCAIISDFYWQRYLNLNKRCEKKGPRNGPTTIFFSRQKLRQKFNRVRVYHYVVSSENGVEEEAVFMTVSILRSRFLMWNLKFTLSCKDWGYVSHISDGIWHQEIQSQTGSGHQFMYQWPLVPRCTLPTSDEHNWRGE